MWDPRTVTRTATISGASRGIGTAIAERLSRDGLAIVSSYAHGSDQAAALAEKIAAAGGRAVAVRADSADPAAVSALFDDHEAICKTWISELGRFTLDPFHQMPGTNI